MTFTGPNAVTWGEALAALRDNIDSISGWSIIDTSANGGATPLTAGEWFVLETPNGENHRLKIRDNRYSGGITMESGPSWDAGNTTWEDRYANDIAQKTGSDGYGDPMAYAPDDRGGERMSMSHSVSYYLDYTDSGWVFYAERNEGDGNDEDLAIGMAELSKTWDFDSAANRESNYATLWHAQAFNADYDNREKRQWTNFLPAMSGTQSGSTHHGRGMVNPDNNYANYTTTDNVVASSQYRNNRNNDAIIGTHDLWIREESGQDASHEDTIQDSGANNLYKLLKAHNVAQVGIGMR
ncbi:hypothetical protein BVU17_02370 [Haloarcula taiwanensis]|uniref:Uncharacterized protein n=1 Tax=Haloarcula taiwanensis TaxID=1932004 RepID=A0A2H4ZVC5_9EURY|nr:hypothetical protein [Haloarcula taiwanensis]AUG46421.1 hypothetical protein BVU17_02370 [Haloarcula taiwanensis]